MRHECCGIYRLGFVFLIVTLASCSSSRTEPAAPDIPAMASRAQLAALLPLGSLPQDLFDLHRLVQGSIDTSVTACLKSAGFVYSAKSIEPASILFNSYGLLPGDRIEPYSSTNAPVVGSTNLIGSVATRNSAYDLALYGPTTPKPVPVKDSGGRTVGVVYEQGGCLGSSEANVFGSIENYHAFGADDVLIQTLVSDERDSLWSIPEVVAAVEPWRRCMLQMGAPDPNRLDFYLSYQWDTVGNEIQIKIAEHEIECKESTDVVREVFKVDWMQQTRLIEQYQDLFRRYHSYLAKLSRS